MTHNDDFIGQLEAYLEEFEGTTPLPNEVRHAVRAVLPTTKQLGMFGGLARRFPIMNNSIVRFGLAAAAVVVAAFLLVRFLPAGNVGSDAEPTPTPATSATPAPKPGADVYPSAGPLAIGRHSLTVSGVPVSFDVPNTGWRVDENTFITRSVGAEDTAGFLFWSPINVYSDNCAKTALSPPAGLSAADLASAIASAHGANATGPSDVTLGGHDAKYVEVHIPDDAGCIGEDPTHFYLWYNDCSGIPISDADQCYRYATAKGDTIRVWVVDVGGARLTVEAESRATVSPEVEQEIQELVDSIQFE